MNTQTEEKEDGIIGGLKDLTNQRFGRLVVVERAEDYVQSSGHKSPQWLCKCDCGKEVIILGGSLTRKNHNTKSCGCIQREKVIKNLKKYNTYDLSGEYGIGYTSKGEEFYFDLEDYDLIKDYCWYIDSHGYVIAGYSHYDSIKMHRLITDCPDGLTVDHIHGVSSRHDNRKLNLRVATIQENSMNCKISKNNTSGVTGVHFNKNINKWIARIGYRNKRINLGSFDNFEDAVKTRKEAEDRYFGEFSYDNSQNMKGDV